MAVAKKKPKKKTAPKKPRYADNLGGLHSLLSKAFPTRRTGYGVFDVKWLAEQLKMTDKAIYYWFQHDSLPFSRARDVVALKGCKVSLEKLLPFVS